MDPTRTPEALMGRMEALAEPTRLRLLRLLERHELGVAELVEVLQLPQSTVSRHLKVLSEHGWVASRADGTANRYRMLPRQELEAGARRLWLVARDETEGWATLRQDELRLERRLRERTTTAQEFFAGAAAQWDRLRGELYGASFVQAALVALLPRGWTVADLGCGTAPVAAALAPHVARVVGVDNSSAMLKAARRRCQGLANVELRQGELEALPLAAAECDAALMLLALSYVDDPVAALAEMARVLRPGGRAVIVDLLPHDAEELRRRMGQHHAGFAPKALEAMLDEAGFTEVRTLELPPETGVTGPALFLASAERAEAPRTLSSNKETQGR